VTVKKGDCNFSVKIKVLNFKIKFSGRFQNSVKFVFYFFQIHSIGRLVQAQGSMLMRNPDLPRAGKGIVFSH